MHETDDFARGDDHVHIVNGVDGVFLDLRAEAACEFLRDVELFGETLGDRFEFHDRVGHAAVPRSRPSISGWWHLTA